MYKQNHSLPLHWEQARQSCESMYQPLGYEVKLWTDDELDRFMLLNYPDAYHGLFQTYRYQIQRIDAVRYFLLYHYGGIYLDLDIGCKKDITDLLYTINLQQPTAVLPMTAPFGVSNDLVISPARHPFAKLMMDQLESHNYDLMLKSVTVLLSTGPAFVDRCIRLYAMQYGYHSGLAILPHEWIPP
ncbi:hypothetical protein MIR68_002351 [Amoeboaphelidium protococcarum]|nr:hypothetical protein MIR68_002351 [Amoeboaphelidium protococcarum]